MRLCFAGAALIGLMLAGCDRGESALAGSRAEPKGRYAGIGTFDADQLWEQMADAKSPTDTAAANTADDQQIIVVIDTQTGEVRQCGNHSGYCTTMNPWSGTPSPVKLKKHASDLLAETEAEPASTMPAESQ